MWLETISLLEIEKISVLHETRVSSCAFRMDPPGIAMAKLPRSAMAAFAASATWNFWGKWLCRFFFLKEGQPKYRGLCMNQKWPRWFLNFAGCIWYSRTCGLLWCWAYAKEHWIHLGGGGGLAAYGRWYQAPSINEWQTFLEVRAIMHSCKILAVHSRNQIYIWKK